MPKPTAKKTKAKKNPTEINLLARSIVEAAIGEPLAPKKPRKKKAADKKAK
ncbi:MAG: hypothetical protein Q7V58_08765 [Actinomycetota bacterium]|nr:hypothetical protein [Actinomycetota bacterium]